MNETKLESKSLNSYFKIAKIMTSIAVFFAIVDSFLGIFLNDLYRDNGLIKAIWRGNDIVTFIIVVPVTIWSLIKSNKRPVQEIKIFLIWMGCLWYMVYNYIFYLYGAAFNVFFLSYVAIIVSCSLALIHGFIFIGSEIKTILSADKLKTSFNRISIFLFVFAFLLGGAWITMASTFLFTGQVPVAITQTGHPTGVVFATDLVFLVTPLVVLGIYLRKQKPWAILLTPVIMVKCCLYPLVLVVAGFLAYFEKGAYDVLTPAYIFLGLGAAISLTQLFRRL